MGTIRAVDYKQEVRGEKDFCVPKEDEVGKIQAVLETLMRQSSSPHEDGGAEHRWPAQIDPEVRKWLKAAYDLDA